MPERSMNRVMLPPMRPLWLLIASVLVVGSACRQAQPTPLAEPVLLSTATIRDIMDSMVDPSADVGICGFIVFIKNQVAAGPKGDHELKGILHALQ